MKSNCRKAGVIALALMMGASFVHGQEPLASKLPASPDTGKPVSQSLGAIVTKPGDIVSPAIPTEVWQGESGGRGFLESDRAFDGFIGPITNPILSKDPRSTTEARLLFINNQIDPANPLGSGNFQAYAMQVRLALTDRLTFIADKDGYASIHPRGGPSQSGFLNLGAGLRYLFVRDPENQFLWSGGFMYEIPSGEANAFSGHGSGTISAFTTIGKEFANKVHFVGTTGYQFGVDGANNSDFFFTSLHVDKSFGKFYPLAELNWFHYSGGGNRGLPRALGEGDGLLNLGTSGVAGNDLVTGALGAKYRFNTRAEIGAAWEVPLSNRHDLLNNRLTIDFILRY
jgi:hypothetical protein